jgi:hypothetical protein
MGFAAPVMLAMGVAGAGISAIGAYDQGQAASANAQYQAQVARNNAAIAGQNETWTSASGAAEEAAQGMKTRARVGSIKAAQGANNIDPNTGSATSTSTAAREVGDLDAMTIRSNTARKAYGYAVEAESDTAQSQLLEQEGSQAKTAGDLSAAGTLLSGVSSVGSKWAGFQNNSPNAGSPTPTVSDLAIS